MSQRHQFHLRWSNYGQNLANSFVRLFESESLSDVTLFCEGESYRAHRVVLAASSVHFQELFEQCSTAQNLVVILDGTLAANLRALLEFMYKGEVYIDDANLNTFLQTAKRLQVKGLSLSQNDLHNISGGVGDERSPPSGHQPPLVDKFSHSMIGGSSSSSGQQDTILAQALGPILIPQQGQSGLIHPSQAVNTSAPLQNKNTNSIVQSPPPQPFSTPSPTRTPPNTVHLPPCGVYGEDKPRKKNRIPSPPRQSPNGTLGESSEYSNLHHPIRPSAPIPALSPTMNQQRILEMEQRERSGGMSGGNTFSTFGGHYVTAGQVPSSVPPPVPLQQSHQQQQQTIVITENPNIRKIRSASTENTMPEDLSIKLEPGRGDELSGKQRSFSMDLSPSEPSSQYGPPGGVTGGPSVWPLPPTSNISRTTQPHDLNHTQTTADGKNGKKLKCPFCERLYGYETNLRAHIRQRHQGIRVPCPFCTRTFTRNNTVRRHVAREHRALLGGTGVRPFPHLHGPNENPPAPPFTSPPRGSTIGSAGGAGSSGSSPTQGSPGATCSSGIGGSHSGTSPPNRPNSTGGGKLLD